MRRLLGFALLIPVVLVLANAFSTRLDAQRVRDQAGRAQVCFYTDENYRGDSFCVNAGENQRNVGERFNDRISSIRIIGRTEVTVYEDENFGGPSQTFSQDVPNLRDWNDRITSFQVSGGRYQGQRGGGASGSEPRNGACFYMDEGYRGDSFCLNSGQSNKNIGNRYNDRISSIRVFGRARVIVFDNENFGGESLTIDRDVSNLGRFNDRITSIQVK